MYISKVQVEGGFLDGLDLSLANGLNTIIGSRGTGKTSIIQLIRFATGSQNSNSDFFEENENHARSILGDGQVTVTFTTPNGDTIQSTRVSDDDKHRSAYEFDVPIIYSQTEIERIGLLPSSRLKLIDGFLVSDRKLFQAESGLISKIKSLTTQASSIRGNLDELLSQTDRGAELTTQLKLLQKDEKKIESTSTEIKALNYKIKLLADDISSLSVADNQWNRLKDAMTKRLFGINSLIENWSAADSILENFKEEDLYIDASIKALKKLNEAKALTAKMVEKASEQLQVNQAKKMQAENEARELRNKVNEFEKGFGEVSRKLQVLKSQLAQLSSLKEHANVLKNEISETLKKRDTYFDELDQLRHRRFEARQNVVSMLNKRLSPTIYCEVEHLGQKNRYEREIANQLRGSGLRFKDIAAFLSDNVSPRELVNWAEGFEFKLMAKVTDMSEDRAARFLSALRKGDLGSLATVEIEDDVFLFLLDGADRKPLDILSMGQRCTVILPIILEREDTIIILDQPEDHIDNAFIADTLIKSIEDRVKKGQLIVSTHNANIPVLGGSDKVILLESDGKRGFVKLSEKLDHPSSVNAITSLMEGGKKAFEARAKFYSEN